MQTKSKFETGASTHAVNDLILFTDNTRELAELRDEICKLWVDKGYTPSYYMFDELLRTAIKTYCKELVDHEHIKYMGKSDRQMYKTIYLAGFEDWKSEHGYK